jgi:hypothetical protein
MRVFVVAGYGNFPFRMLARNCAWPATEDEAQKIYYACPTQAPRQEIALASLERPQIQMWAGFNWPVVRVQS